MLLTLIAQATQQAAPAAGDALTGGGIVGGIVTAVGALYVIWEKVSKRRAESRKEDLAAREQEIRLEELSRQKVGEAYEHLMGVRKAARDAEIAGISARLVELESREQKCQSECAMLNAQNAAQAVEIASLRARIVELEQRLKATGALPPGTDLHAPLPPVV